MTTLPLLLSGAVLACGALLILSGATKLYQTTRRTHASKADANSDSAIRAALRISPHRWRRIELTAAVIEATTGVAICAAFHPAVAGTALAALGAIFTALLAYARRAKSSGGCSCIRPSKDPDAPIRWPVQARAAWLLAAGTIETLVPLPRPAPATGRGLVIGLVALSTLILMLAAEGPWPATRCLRVPLRPRTTLRALMNHGVFVTMSDAVGPFADGFAYRREGCVEEFRFAATPRPGRADRAVAFRVSRTAHGRGLAVEARIEPATTR